MIDLFCNCESLVARLPKVFLICSGSRVCSEVM
uniref:Uncharacterized protein n=1 Tax=Arundo donax TaxID=35708 RepID=A0A0A9G1C3_ARUDO